MHKHQRALGLAITLATLLIGAGPASAAPPTDSQLEALKGQIVAVHTQTNQRHPGRLVHFDARTVTVHLGNWRSTTVERHRIRSITSRGASKGPKRVALRRSRVVEQRPSPQRKLSLSLKRTQKDVDKSQTLLAGGITLLALGLAGTIGGAVGAYKKVKSARESDRTCSDDDCGAFKFELPGFGLGFLAVVSGVVAVVGLVMTVKGANRLSKATKVLKKYRPRLTIDPQTKTYAASMSLSF